MCFEEFSDHPMVLSKAKFIPASPSSGQSPELKFALVSELILLITASLSLVRVNLCSATFLNVLPLTSSWNSTNP